MSRQKNWLRVVSLALVLMALLGACAPPATPVPPAETPKPAEPKPTEAPPEAPAEAPPEAPPEVPTVVKIGYPLPLSGSMGTTGVEVQNAVKMAVEIVNNAYPDLNLPMAKDAGFPNLNGAKLEIVWADHEGSPEKAASETERLITEEGVVAVEGNYASSCAATSSMVCERLSIPFLSDISSSPTLHERGLKWFFRMSPHDREGAEFLIQALKDIEEQKGIEISSVATLYENTLYGADSSREANNFAREYGLKVVANIPYPYETADMTSEIGTLKAANPDVVISASYIGDAILTVKTFEAQDYIPHAYVGMASGQLMMPYVETLGADADYTLVIDSFALDEGTNKPLVKVVNDMYREEYGSNFTGETALPFMGLLTMADAINRAGSVEPEAIRQALRETDIPPDQIMGALAGIRFDPETGQNELGAKFLLQIQDGEYRIVWPFDRATVDLVWPIPKWSER